MKIKETFLFTICGVVICISLLIHICLPIRAFAQSPAPLTGIQVKRIGVTPFFKGRHDSSIGETLSAPLSQLQFNPEDIVATCDRVLTGYVQEALQKRYGERVMPLNDVTTVFERISKNEDEDTPRDLAQKTGHALGADLIIVGMVWKFKERVGGAMGVESPASVAFAIGLIDVADGRMLWKAAFDKTQRSLSEDIRDARAFFQKGAKWLTANELARYGVNEIFKKFPR